LDEDEEFFEDGRWKMGRLFVYDYGYVYESFGLWMNVRPEAGKPV